MSLIALVNRASQYARHSQQQQIRGLIKHLYSVGEIFMQSTHQGIFRGAWAELGPSQGNLGDIILLDPYSTAELRASFVHQHNATWNGFMSESNIFRLGCVQ